MSKLPAVRPSDLARAIFLHAAGRKRVVIPMRNRDLKPGTLHGLLDDMGLTRDQLIQLL